MVHCPSESQEVIEEVQCSSRGLFVSLTDDVVVAVEFADVGVITVIVTVVVVITSPFTTPSGNGVVYTRDLTEE